MPNNKSEKKLLTTHYSLPTKSGFTMVELMVTISIMVIISTVLLFNHSRFGNNITLEDLSYQVALTIRQAQSYGMNVKGSGAGAGDFDYAYGVHFDNTTPANSQSFILFVDSTADGVYNGPSEYLDTYNITQGNFIEWLCVDAQCSNPETASDGQVDITFRRPNPDALIRKSGVAGLRGMAEIYVSSSDSSLKKRVINVTNTGQISISVY
ncbi:hypothetical protein A2442_02185 [Candidatus Campbellbacteria bacterium RIFOXYC2_FULL_35_25]|uniref:General secretion pathway GspH domain-containing protein n=1 Tax=Candidatus Campbellbacteria bacterium RIFOXYC2_FULL_35_25 TaxID=1797582 RepID=A0A1F5EIB6_9BACT|nr:MAG: hypothetical protein A2442_02185 [Candidatus Campbellbacteria bacterium RIFOXYC2_FULL_35_25]